MTEDALKPRVDFLHTAFLWLAGIMITAVIALIGVILTTTGAINARIDKIPESISTLNRQVGEVSVKQDDTNKRLDRIDGKLDTIVAKIK